MAVLGGAGAMGRAAVHHLAVAGRRVLRPGCRCRRRPSRPPVSTGERRPAPPPWMRAIPRRLARALRGAAVVVHCAPYAFNLGVMQAALEAGCHYVDLGGLFHTTRRQLRLDREFRRAGLLAVLGMGSAPGITNVMARLAADLLDGVRAIRVYNGGARLHPLRRAAGLRVHPRHRARRAEPAADGVHGRPLPGRARRCRRERTSTSISERRGCTPASTPRSRPSPSRTGGKGIRECAFKIAYDPVAHRAHEAAHRPRPRRHPSRLRAGWRRAPCSSTASAGCRRRRPS